MSLFGRKKGPESQQVAAARETIAQHGSPRPVILQAVDKIDDAISAAVDERDRLSETIADADGDGVATELKVALRARPSPTAIDTADIIALRRRHETVNALMNRYDELGDAIAQLLADLETLVSRSALADADDVNDDVDSKLKDL